jgi:hypothetical protein
MMERSNGLRFHPVKISPTSSFLAKFARSQPTHEKSQVVPGANALFTKRGSEERENLIDPHPANS